MNLKTVTFTMSKGGVGKSLITANVGAALADKGKKVIIVDSDPNRPIQTILGLDLSEDSVKLDDVIKGNLDIGSALYESQVENLHVVPSGMSLEDYFSVDPVKFAEKIASLKADFVFVDSPFPLGSAALLSLGICQYFFIILTEDEFVLCIESAIDTLRLGSYLLKSVPLGFILNRIKNPEKFNSEFIADIENLLEIPCVAMIKEDPNIWKSYGELKSGEAFLAYKKFRKSDFAKNIEKISSILFGRLPNPRKEDIPGFVKQVIGPLLL